MKRNQQLEHTALRLAFGIVYLWFGILKFFPQASPAESLAKDTIDHLFLSFFPQNISILLLAGWETLIGLGMFLNKKMRIVIGAALVHMFFTFSPLFIFPELSFTRPPFEFSIVGQYIVKNLVFVAGLFILYPKKQETAG